MLLLVVDSLKEEMPLRSLFRDFETVRAGVEVHGCSLWVRPYTPTPLIVFDMASDDIAIGEVIKAPTKARLLDFINFQAQLYPHSQLMVMNIVGTPIVGANPNFFYSQATAPNLSSGYAKIESGNFSKEIHDSLWNDVMTDSVWLE